MNLCRLKWELYGCIINSRIRVEYGPCDIVDGEASPPPTNLLQRDLKEDYSVQIPHRAVTLFNLFLLEKSMTDVVSLLRQK